MNFADFMGGVVVPAKASVGSSKIKGVPFIDKAITYKTNKGTSQVYQCTVDDHFVNVYANGVQTGETQRVLDLWVYPEDDKGHFTNKKGEEAAFQPCIDVKNYLDGQLKKIPFVSFEMKEFSVDGLKSAIIAEGFTVVDFIKGLCHSGVKIAEVKDDEGKHKGWKTCMIKLRVVELADGKYSFKVLKSMPFKRG